MLGEIISKNDRDEHYKILSVYYTLVSEETKGESHYYKYDARGGFVDHLEKLIYKLFVSLEKTEEIRFFCL